MAVLEKIREKKALTTIVIGGALLMFILTMNAGSKTGGCTGQDLTLAEVDGNKIEYDQFAKLSQVQNALNKDNQQNISSDDINEQILGQMVFNAIIDEECEDAAITVGKEELSARMGLTMREDNQPYQPSSAVQQIVNHYQAAPVQIKEAAEKGTIDNQKIDPSTVAEIKALWENAITETEEEIKLEKLGWLLSNCFLPNDFDREQVQNDMTNQFAVEYAQVNYTGADEFNATDREIGAEYDKLKEMFRIDNEMRAVHMLTVPLMPSDADLKEADVTFNKALKELNDSTSKGFDVLRNYDNFQQSVQNFYTADGKLQSGAQGGDLAQLVAMAGNDSIALRAINGNVGATTFAPRADGYSARIYKLFNRFTVADSVKLDMVQLVGNKQFQDSVIALLNSGTNADSLAAKLGNEKMQLQHGEQAFRGYQIPDSVREKVNNNADFFVFVRNDEAAVLWKVTSKAAPKTFNELGIAQYNYIPSANTNGKAQNDLQKVLNNYKKAADLEKAINDAKKGDLLKYQEYLSEDLLANTQSTVGRINKTRNVIKWVFNDAKKGDISQIMNIPVDNYHNVLVVAMVDDIYKDYLPATASQVKEMLGNRVKARKEGEAIIKKNKTNDVNAFASKAGVEVQADTVSFLGRSGNLAAEPKVLGFIAGAKKGKSAQIAGDHSVVVVKVGNKVANQMDKLPKAQLSQQASSMMGLTQAVILHSRKVKMQPTKFF